MKKILFALTFICSISTVVVTAQDYKQAKKLYDLGIVANAASKLEEAKVEIDKIMADEKAAIKPENWLLKMQIYAALTANEKLNAKYPSVDNDAIAALKKYLELEPTEAKLKAEKFEGINAIYTGIYASGIRLYNAQQWDASHEKFKTMAAFGDVLIQRKWTTATFDTTAYLYAGATAQNAKKDEVAASYYRGLADLKMKGDNYDGIYEFLTKYYLNSNKETEFNKYVGIAKEVYPANPMWGELEFYFMSKNYTTEQMIKKYDEQDASGKLTAANYFEYGNYFVGDEKIKDIEEAKRKPYTKKAMAAFIKSYQLDSTNGLAAYNAGVTAYNIWETQYEAARLMKGTTPEIKAQRAEADKMADADADKSITWMENAFKTLERKKDRNGLETSVLNKAVDFLFNLFQFKRERTKTLAPKEYDKYDAKMKFYDALHNKYKA